MKKKTVVRKISWKDYVTVLWILEHQKEYIEGEVVDLSMFPQETLDKVEKRCLYVSDEENELIKNYLGARRKKNTFESMVKDQAKDPKYVTKTVGSTIRYKTQTNIAQSAILTQIAAPVDKPMTAEDAEVLEQEARKGINANKPVLPVYSDEERWSLALQLDKKRIEGNDVDFNRFISQINITDYLFIKNHNIVADTMDKIDWKVLFYMIETGKVGALEAKLVIDHYGAKGFIDKVPKDFLYLGVPKFYEYDSTMLSAMLKAEDYSGKYEAALKDPEPTREDTLKRFKEYVKRNKFKKVLNEQIYSDALADHVKSIKGKKVIMQGDDEDGGDPFVNECTYVSQEMMLNDFVCFEDAFGLDPNQVYDVFGNKISINGYIEMLYQEYPHGFYDDFYRTRIEAYEAGAAQICDL